MTKDGEVTSKLLYLHKSETKLEDENLERNKKHLYKDLEELYVSGCKSLIFKHILRVQQALANIGFQRFKICEIPCQKKTGDLNDTGTKNSNLMLQYFNAKS